MKRRSVIIIIITVLAVYALLVSSVPILDKLVLFPSTRSIGSRGAIRNAIRYEGGELEIWIAGSAAARAAGRTETFVLRFYGNADRPERWVAAEADMFQHRAVEVWGAAAVAFVCCLGAAGSAFAQPNIDTKNFAVDCRQLRGNTQRGLVATRENLPGFTIVLSDKAHAYYNAPNSPGLRYWVVAGDIPHLKPFHKPIIAFASKQQKVQAYGTLEQMKVYTIYHTPRWDGEERRRAHRDQGAALRPVC